MTIFEGKMEKNIKKITSNKKPFSPHHPKNHLWRDGHFGDGTKACGFIKTGHRIGY